MITFDEFKKMFTIPRDPATALAPGQHFEMKVPKGKKVVINDIYIENLGEKTSLFEILEQRGPSSFEVRYTIRTASSQVTIINFTTGLKLGDETSIKGSIRIKNATSGTARIIPRVNGIFVD